MLVSNTNLDISIGSTYEIETQFIIAFDLGYVNKEELDNLLNDLDKIIKMIAKFRCILQI